MCNFSQENAINPNDDPDLCRRLASLHQKELHFLTSDICSNDLNCGISYHCSIRIMSCIYFLFRFLLCECFRSVLTINQYSSMPRLVHYLNQCWPNSLLPDHIAGVDELMAKSVCSCCTACCVILYMKRVCSWHATLALRLSEFGHWVVIDAVQSEYNTISFFLNSNNRYIKVCSWGQALGCLLKCDNSNHCRYYEHCNYSIQRQWT